MSAPKQIETAEQLSELMKKLSDFHFQRGVLTNNFLSPQMLERDVQAGRLLAYDFSGGVLVFRQRGGHFRMYYDLLPTEELEQSLEALDFPTPCVTEIAMRQGGENSAVSCFEKRGFVCGLERVRLTRRSDERVDLGPWAGEVKLAAEADCAELLASMKESFDELMGCLPTRDELMADIKDGEVLVAKKDGELCGYLQMRRSNAFVEIQHVATLPHARGQKLAQRLMAEYINNFPTKTRRSWVGKDNLASLNLHRRNGFAEDGYTSKVLVLR